MPLKAWGNTENESQVKNKFGLLSILQRQVDRKAGASYTLPGIFGKDKELYQFKGKVLNPQGTDQHIILVLEAKNSQGEIYQAVREDLDWSAPMKLAAASLLDVFGDEFLNIFDNGAKVPVQVQEVPYLEWDKQTRTMVPAKTNNGSDKTTFKVVTKFDNVDAMQAASDKYFGKFRPAAPNGAAVNGIPADVMYDANALWEALAGNETMFRSFAAQSVKLSSVPLDELVAAVSVKQAA